MKLTSRTPATAMAVLALAACSTADAEPGFTTRDSAGVAIVENTRPSWGDEEGWSVLPTPEVDIGVLDGEEPYLLSQVTGAQRLSDGRIVVANGGTHQLRFYDTGGSHLKSTGGEGGGPGEFQRLGSIRALAGDSLLVYDWSSRRMSFFGPDGTFLTSANLETGEGVQFPQVLGMLEDKTVLASSGAVFTSGSPSGVTRTPVAVLAYSPAGELLDTVADLPGNELYVLTRDRGISVRALPFGKQGVSTVHGRYLWAGETENFEVRAYTAQGTMERIVRLKEEARPVTDADIEAYVAQQLQSIDDEDTRKRQAELFEDIPAPEFMPHFTKVVVDAVGHVWMKRMLPPTDQRRVWAVFDPRGVYLGDVETPEGLDVYQIGEAFVLGRWRDDFDVEHVRLHFLDRSGAPAS